MSNHIRIPDLFRRRPHETSPASLGPLREFVYLDEVSVQSLLVSRTGGVPAEFRESRSLSRATDLGAKADAQIVGINAQRQTSDAQGHEVLSRATVQTAFRDLYEIERANLFLGPQVEGIPSQGGGLEDIAKDLDALAKGHWALDPAEADRGDLFEVEVEIEADPVYQVAEVVAAFVEIVEPIPNLSADASLAGIDDVKAVARVMDALLTGLVPIRGRLVDYRAVDIGGREVLVHRNVLEDVGEDDKQKILPVFVAGVAERDLFWKDIRRVVFSEARHTLFGRLTTSGIVERWQPLKAAEVISAAVPNFGEVFEGFGRVAAGALERASQPAAEPLDGATDLAAELTREYVTILATYHQKALSPDLVDSIVCDASAQGAWLSTVDDRSAVLRQVNSRVDAALGVETPPDIAYRTRQEALAGVGLSLLPNSLLPSGQQHSVMPPSQPERFLEAEIIAVYW